jgi:hypothetical protein
MRLTAALTALLITCAHADELKPAAEIKALHSLAGEWTCNEKVAGAEGGTGVGSMMARVGPGGHSVIADYATITGPRTGYRMHEVFTWDPAEKVYRLLRVDGFSAGAAIAAGTRAGKDIVFEAKSAGETRRTTLTLHGDDNFDVVTATLTLKFERKGPPPR